MGGEREEKKSSFLKKRTKKLSPCLGADGAEATASGGGLGKNHLASG
jgi:hypothetical protein